MAKLTESRERQRQVSRRSPSSPKASYVGQTRGGHQIKKKKISGWMTLGSETVSTLSQV